MAETKALNAEVLQPVESRLTSLRYRVADHVHSVFACVPAVKKSVKWLLQSSGQALHLLTPRKSSEESKSAV